MKLQPIRGTRDILSTESKQMRHIMDVALKIASKYMFEEIQTPIFEQSEVFHRSLGETSDVVSKETYTFLDRDKTMITLRPEFTAGTVRAFISNGLTQSTPQKLFSAGPVFRHERPQKCRYRQFNQINFEYLGAKTAYTDIEIIALAMDIITELGLRDKVVLNINSIGDQESRLAYREALVTYFSKHISKLSEDSKIRLQKNPLRILDSKDDGDRKLVEDAPLMHDHMSDHAKQYFTTVLQGLDDLAISYTINTKLVRGLDYYTHTVFEFVTSELGSQGTVLAGGRYDGLVELMGGPHTPSIGFAAGIERLAELFKNSAQPSSEPNILSVIPIGETAEKSAVKLCHELRAYGAKVDIDCQTNIGKKMKRADKIGSAFAIIFGDEELKQSRYKLKNLKTGQESDVSREELLNLAMAQSA